ncbi:MAG: hypothetical protein CL902_07880 [Dehalococcoidia bacterium]|nr:hypothetical protein [Dehalococcoidia bacterium]
MPFPGRPFRTIMSRAFQRYRTNRASKGLTEDHLDSQATAEWPTTEAEPVVTPTIDPMIESVFEKKETSTDLSQKYEEASTSSPFKQITADQIE